MDKMKISGALLLAMMQPNAVEMEQSEIIEYNPQPVLIERPTCDRLIDDLREDRFAHLDQILCEEDGETTVIEVGFDDHEGLKLGFTFKNGQMSPYIRHFAEQMSMSIGGNYDRGWKYAKTTIASIQDPDVVKDMSACVSVWWYAKDHGAEVAGTPMMCMALGTTLNSKDNYYINDWAVLPGYDKEQQVYMAWLDVPPGGMHLGEDEIKIYAPDEVSLMREVYKFVGDKDEVFVSQ